MTPRRRTLSHGLAAIALLALGACSSTPEREPGGDAVAARAAEHALRMQGKPYRYGGNTPAGFDCSGLVQYGYARAGVKVPHGTDALRSMSSPIKTRHLQRGDLVFFNQEGKRSSHVGIYVGNNRFVHAPSSGKHVYIANLADAYWRKHFAGARRLLWD